MSDALRTLKDAAAELQSKGKLKAALEAWQQVVAAAPEEIAAHQKVAELLTKLGKTAAAVLVYEEVAKRYAEKGLFFKASAACRVLLSLDPQHERTQELIASLYARSTASLKPPPPPPILRQPAPAPSPAPAAKEVEATPVVPPPPPVEGRLPSIPLFSTLGHDELKALLSTAMEVRAFDAGEVIVAEGEPGSSMYALVEGAAGIYRGWGAPSPRRVAQVASGDIFGEVAMVSGAARVATVVADVAAVALEFPREAMQKVVARHPGVGQMLEQFYRERLVANALRASPVLRSLKDAEKRELTASFRSSTFADGARIIVEGQGADAVHMVLRGECHATHQSGQRYPDLREGDLFGEIAVLTNGPATATVTAAGPLLTLRLPAPEFSAFVLRDPVASLAVKRIAKERLARTAQFDQEEEVVLDDLAEDSRV